MERYVFPRIGGRPVSEVDTGDVLEILTPIWHVKAATARENPPAHPRGPGVGDRHGPAERQPVRPGGAGARSAERHRDRQALPHKDVAAAIETVRGGAAQPAVRLTFEFLVLTAVRSD